MSKKILFSLPSPSTAIVSSPALYTEIADLVVALELDSEEIAPSLTLRFIKQRAFRKRSELYCTPWHIENAYDTLCEIEESDWVAELRAAAASDQRNAWTLRHFMIYIEDLGCLEVVAESVILE